MRKLLLAGPVLLLGSLWAAPLLAMTLAVGYFDNRSGQDQWQPLSKGLADMLITDLAATGGVTVVERDRLQAVLGEIQLGKGKFIDPSTAQKLGKGLGASHVLIGSFAVSGTKVRIDARAIEVATGAVRVTAEHTGPSDDVFAVETKLAEKLRDGLALKRQGEAHPTKVSADDLRTYGQGLEALDEGRVDEARRILGALALQRPDFSQVQRGLDQLAKKIKALLEQSKYAPEKIVALAGQLEDGKLEACGPLLTELMQLQAAASRATMKILTPDGTPKTEVAKPLAAFYAVTALLLDRPPLAQPICPGSQAPAGTALALFLMTVNLPAQQVMDCHPDRLALLPNAKVRADQCQRMVGRIPDLSDAQGKVLVATGDYPALMVQLGQVLVERFPASPYLQAVLPMISNYVEFMRVTTLSGVDKQTAQAKTMVANARQYVLQRTAYGDLYLATVMVPLDPRIQQSQPGVQGMASLGIGEGELAQGLGQIELSTDGGKMFGHHWPLKTEPPGYAVPSTGMTAEAKGQQLVGPIERRPQAGAAPEIEFAAKWYQRAFWLGAPWTEAAMPGLMFRLVGLDGSELARCPVQVDAETSARTAGKWLYAKVMCKSPP